MNKIHFFIIVTIFSIVAGALSPALMTSSQSGIIVRSIPAHNSSGDDNSYDPWIPISCFAPHVTTLQDAQEKLAVPFKIPSTNMIEDLGMTLNAVLYGGSEEKYSIVYLIYGTAPIDPYTMSVSDIVNSGHVVVIQTNSGLTIGDVQGLYDNVKAGKFPSDQVTYVNGISAILSPNQIAIYQGTVIYNILIPNNISANQLLAFSDSMFE